MFQANLTSVTMFFFLGFSHYPKGEIITLLQLLADVPDHLTGKYDSDSITILIPFTHLCTSFLSNLSCLDIWYTSSAFPPMLINFISGKTPSHS